MSETTIETNCYGIIVTLTGDGGAGISSELHEPCPCCGGFDCYRDCADTTHIMLEDEDDMEERLDFNKRMDAIESMVMAHACAGIDIMAPAYIEGIETAVQACGNQG
jgi:hypothetical protein